MTDALASALLGYRSICEPHHFRRLILRRLLSPSNYSMSGFHRGLQIRGVKPEETGTIRGYCFPPF